MELQRQPPRLNGLSTPVKIAIGAITVWVGLTIAQWIVLSAFRFVRFGLLVAVGVAVLAFVLGDSEN